MTNSHPLSRLACGLLAVMACTTCRAEGSASDPTPEMQIRAERERFNRAIEEGDPSALEGLFAPDYHLVTGRSDQFHGGPEHLRLWRQTFSSDPTFNCQRTPEAVTTNGDWGLAQETGRWLCTQTVDGKPSRYSGVYAAKWQRATDGAWMLQTEVFTTMACEGPDSACRRPDPIGAPSPAD